MATVEGTGQGRSSPMASAGGTRDEDVTNEDVKRLQLAKVFGYSGEWHGNYCCLLTCTSARFED